MKDFKWLKFLDKLQKFFQKCGVDYPIMRKILQVKLTMDERRVPTIMNNSKKNNEDKNNFFSSLWVYILMGLFMIPFVINKKNYTFNMSIAFGIIMFMVMTSLISDFSSVLLDLRDKDIINTKPINSRTKSTAKIIHIFIYMASITMAIATPSLIISLFRQGPLFFLIYLFEIFLMDIFIVVLTALLYMSILKFFDGEKLKDIINYFQIILSLAITIGYQFLGRLFEIVNVNVVFTPKWWQYLIIPIWYGAPFDLILRGDVNIYYIIFTILAVIIPIISIAVYIKLTPSFINNLNKLSNNSYKASKKGKNLSYILSNLVCFKKQEKTFFRFTADMVKNERDFKLKVYPSLGFAAIFPFIFLFNNLRGSSFSAVSNSKMYLNIYFSAIMLPTIIMMMKYSSKYKASWIYRTTPITDTSSILKGSLKAFIVILLCPVYLFVCIAFIVIFGPRIIPDLILVFINILLFTVICVNLMKKGLPFSIPYEASNKNEGLIALPLMIIIGIFAGIHYACTFYIYGIYIYMAVSILLNILLWKISLKVQI